LAAAAAVGATDGTFGAGCTTHWLLIGDGDGLASEVAAAAPFLAAALLLGLGE